MNRLSRVVLWAFVSGGARIAAACPLCADNLSNDVYGKSPTQLGRGFFWSIIFMMAFPFLTAAMVATRILIARKRRARAASAPAAETGPGMPVPDPSA
ncbi:MAG TPA: hypothetical protein VG777_00760 [Thermoanaerobaculia bacterium]|nr:hypothetical protein [Thermoanaerobaculia bacterium]